MNYEQAEREFQRIEALRQSGSIDETAYRARLEALRVTDEQGRTWMLQESTGQWFVYDQGQWIAATPPGREARAQSVQPPPAARPADERPTSRIEAISPMEKRPGCFSITLRIMLWTFVWLGAAWAVDALPRITPSWAYWAVGLGALVTLVLWVRWMTRHGRARRSQMQGGAA